MHEECNGPLPVTTLNYTGQRHDGTALIYDHVHYYNPAWGRFISPDSVVSGTASGSGGAEDTIGSGSTTPLIVDFHEPGFANQLSRHNAAMGSMGFWFQSSSDHLSCYLVGESLLNSLLYFSRGFKEIPSHRAKASGRKRDLTIIRLNVTVTPDHRVWTWRERRAVRPSFYTGGSGALRLCQVSALLGASAAAQMKVSKAKTFPSP